MESASIDPITNNPLPRKFTQSTSVLHEFGKVKGIEILTFKDAELERTFCNETRFGSVGVLQVLYFANYDRFVLSLNGWKYVLLKRIPIVSEWQALSGPITFTLPTYKGFYTLRIDKVPHIEALNNFETILLNNSKFSYKGECKTMPSGLLSRGLLSPDDKFRGEVDPLDEPEEPTTSSQYEPGKPNPLKRGDKVKRGFKMIAHKLSKGLKRKGRHNLNLYQVRDLESMKQTTEVMASIHLFPRREVERWITFNKEVATQLGFEPESLAGSETDRFSPKFTQSEYMRGYGSMDLGQGTLEHPLPSHNIGTPTGLGTTTTNHPEGHTHKPGLIEKIKDVITGHHHTGATSTTAGHIDQTTAIPGHHDLPEDQRYKPSISTRMEHRTGGHPMPGEDVIIQGKPREFAERTSNELNPQFEAMKGYQNITHQG
jgi:hypothetical protein